MKLCALLILCGLVCLGEQLEAKTSPAHNVQRRSSSPTNYRPVQVQIEVDAPDPWNLSVGDSVQVRCFLSPDSDLDLARRLMVELCLIQMEVEGGAVGEETVSKIRTIEPKGSKGISYALGPVTLKDRGLYICQAIPLIADVITVKNANKLIWVKDSSPVVSLELLRINRIKYFHDKTLTIGCRLPNDQSEWRIMSANEKTGRMSKCPNQERSGDLLSCTIPSLPFHMTESRRYEAFWCESLSLQKTNILNVTEAELTEVSDRDFLVTFDVTPAWFVREGDSVVIQCDARPEKMNNNEEFDLQLTWTKMGPGNNTMVLLSQRASKPINYTLNNITHEHSGVYSCRDDGTLAHVFGLPRYHFIWVQDDSPAVTINVLSHNRTQFFHNELVAMGCQLPNDQSQWKLKGFDKWTGIIKECDKPDLSSSRLLSCTVKMEHQWSHYLFWCESTTGLKSNVLNITKTDGHHVLEAPPVPVMEGEDFTLRCLRKNKSTDAVTTDIAFFRHNSQTFGWLDGIITFFKVTKKDREGLYSCWLKDTAPTADTYVTVKARTLKEHKTN